VVFSTLHTNDAPEAVSTLYNMGIMPFLISSSLAAVVAQRLIRVICPDCKKKYKPSVAVRKALKITDTKKYIYRGEGCPACFHSGYVGRTGVFEILEVTQAIRKMITEGEDVGKVAKAAHLVPMASKARDKVLAGVTTAEEYFRLTGGE
jgi:type IV pilus assembly protein PilB